MNSFAQDLSQAYGETSCAPEGVEIGWNHEWNQVPYL